MTVGSQLKQTLAAIKGCQGTLRIYTAKSQHPEESSAYKEAVDTLNGIVHDLEERLKIIEFEEPQYKGS